MRCLLEDRQRKGLIFRGQNWENPTQKTLRLRGKMTNFGTNSTTKVGNTPKGQIEPISRMYRVMFDIEASVCRDEVWGRGCRQRMLTSKSQLGWTAHFAKTQRRVSQQLVKASLRKIADCHQICIAVLGKSGRKGSNGWVSSFGLVPVDLSPFKNGQSTVGGPKWTKMDLFRPKWTKMDHFGPFWSREC